jgi:hypothetical protein
LQIIGNGNSRQKKECRDLVEMIIRNNYLNYNICNKRKVYLVDEEELNDKIMKILCIAEPYKLIVTFGLISGLTEKFIVNILNVMMKAIQHLPKTYIS